MLSEAAAAAAAGLILGVNHDVDIVAPPLLANLRLLHFPARVPVVGVVMMVVVVVAAAAAAVVIAQLELDHKIAPQVLESIRELPLCARVGCGDTVNGAHLCLKT